MRIAHIVCSYPPYYSGMGNVVFQTARWLSKLGHEVEVFTPQYYREEEKKLELPRPEEPELGYGATLIERVDYARRLRPRLRYGQAAYLPQVSRELDDFDLVHLHYPFFGTANLVRKWKLAHRDRPLVITYHMDTRAPGWKGLVFKYYSKYWLPKILSVADKLITSSFDYIVSSDARLLFEKDREKWAELPFGVDVERFKPGQKPAVLLQRHGLKPELPIVLFVGGMDAAHHFKGITVLLQALFMLKKNKRGVQVLLVGEGELRKDFEIQAKILNLGLLVKFAGKVNEGDLPYYYNLADLFVLPSINKGEAFGMVLLEAMASGVPVVATDLAGVRTLAQDGGLIIPPNDANSLAEAIYSYFQQSDDARAEWRQKARVVAEEKYAWEPIILRLEQIYNGLVKKM